MLVSLFLCVCVCLCLCFSLQKNVFSSSPSFLLLQHEMGQLAATDGASKASSLDRLKLAASRLLKRTPKPSMTAAVAPSSPPPSQAAPAHRDYATRGGKAAARSLARLSATSMVSMDEDEASAAAAAEAEKDAVVANAVPFSRKSKNGDDAETCAAKPFSPADVVAGRFSLGLPRDLEAKYDLSDKVLGSGGSGIVRLATCKRTGKTVAVKTIPKVRAEMVGAGTGSDEAKSASRLVSGRYSTRRRRRLDSRSSSGGPLLLALFASVGSCERTLSLGATEGDNPRDRANERTSGAV